eukprot:scaffold2224_cov261-Pinguiococcus_pyrenoidosus.AAC.24
MQMRPCLSSASRIQRTSTAFERPSGSKPTSPTCGGGDSVEKVTRLEPQTAPAFRAYQGAIQGRWARHEGKRGRLGGKRGGGLRLGLRNLLALCGRGRGLLGCHAQGASSTPHGRGHEGRALAGHQCQSDNCNSTDHDEA